MATTTTSTETAKRPFNELNVFSIKHSSLQSITEGYKLFIYVASDPHGKSHLTSSCTE